VKLGVLTRQNDALSLLSCRDNIVRELTSLGVVITPFTDVGPIPSDCDVIWEPGIAGNRAPHPIFKDCEKPVVATVHGAAPFSMKSLEFFPGPLKAARGWAKNVRTLLEWRWFREKLSAVIVVSEFGAQEVSRIFALPQGLIHPIHHGVDHDSFHVNGARFATMERKYLLHVAQYQPVKNSLRVFAAYCKLPQNSRPNLVAILPGYQYHHLRLPDIKGTKLIYSSLLPTDLAKWYRGALGLVFPSLRESFGLPILEAMACGCPVVTSNVSACPEVAGDAALLVNPRSVDDIAQAMHRLVKDKSLCYYLRQRGLARAQQFTWRKSAESHLEVFRKVLH